MIDPVRYIARKIALKKHSSTVPTHIIPVSQMRNVTVMIDAMDPDLEFTKKDVKKFFEPYGIKPFFLTPMKWDINLMGWLKTKFRCPGGVERTEDTFISLIGDPDFFAAVYELHCSKAEFKIARFQVPGNVVDISLFDPESSIPRSPQAFAAIRDILMKIE